jgi:adenylate cyclase
MNHVKAGSVERRLVAILAADVVGYSRLMGEAEEATRRTLGTYRGLIEEIVTAHRGRVFGEAGDSVIVEFASPLAAVCCAVEIQHLIGQQNADLPEDRRMRWRIGINLGDVMVDGQNLLGDCVNVAARLEALADPGGILIAGAVHKYVCGKLDLEFEDLGERPLKNIRDPVPQRRHRATRRLRTAAIALAAVFLLGAGTIAITWPWAAGFTMRFVGLEIPPRQPPLPEKPSIAVLPFTNMSDDPQQEYFGDGISEDLTTDLASVRDLFVISRNSAFLYKGKAVRIEDVGRELGVRYVLEGSVRKADGQVRITAQLIDATTGFHVWSERYDRELRDIFAVQSEISEKILASLKVGISAAEIDRIRQKPTDDLRAYDALAEGLFHLNRATKNDNTEARRLFARAIELDPKYASAYALLGQTHLQRSGMGWEFAAQALDLDPLDPSPYKLLAQVNIARGRATDAIAAAERAVALSPNDEWAHVWLGTSQALDLRLIDALGSLRQALRLNPRSPSEIWLIIAYVDWFAGRTKEAVDLWESLRASNPDMIRARILLAAHYVETGREPEARELVREILRVNPKFTVGMAFEILPNVEQHLGPSESAKVRDALHRAGLP